jgi:repressor LexA
MAIRQETLKKLERMKEYIDEFALNNMGQPPSTRELGAAFDMANVSAYHLLQKMAQLGMIQYEHGEIRTDVIDKYRNELVSVGTLCSTLPAGCPDMVDDAYVEEYFPIPAALVRGMSGKFYMMKISGESMIDAGVDDGDYVIFCEDNSARLGDIIVAFVEGRGNTLKRLSRNEHGERFLFAENESWTKDERDFGTEFAVRGVAIKVMKDL